MNQSGTDRCPTRFFLKLKIIIYLFFGGLHHNFLFFLLETRETQYSAGEPVQYRDITLIPPPLFLSKKVLQEVGKLS